MKLNKLLFGIVFIVILSACAGSKGKGGSKKPKDSGNQKSSGGGSGSSSGGTNAPSYGWSPSLSKPHSGSGHDSPGNNGFDPVRNHGYNPSGNQGQNSFANHGYNPSGNQGQNSFANHGYNPSGNQGQNSFANHGYNPSGNQGQNSFANHGYNPSGNQGYNPSGNQGQNSFANHGYNPSGNQGQNSFANQGYNPSGNQGQNSYANQGYNPSGGNQYPYGSQSHIPTHGQQTYNAPYNPSYNSHPSYGQNYVPPPQYTPTGHPSYNSHPSYGQNYVPPPQYTPTGYASSPGIASNLPVGQPTTIFVQSPGQSYSKPGIGQLAKEAFVYAGVNAGVNAAVNRILPGGISGQKHDYPPSSGTSNNGAAPTVTHTQIIHNNYYNNGTTTSTGEPKPLVPGGEQKSPVPAGQPAFMPPSANDSEITLLTENLFAKDKNNGFMHVKMNLQGQKTDDSVTDIAPESLLTVNDMAYEIPTIKSLVSIYENYELDVAVKENLTESRDKKESGLLDQFMETDVMKMTVEFLSNKGYIIDKNFKTDLKRIWFTLFSRTDKGAGSSGFETVFLAEKFNNETIGLHNWIYYAKQEAAKKLNYLGYIHEKKLGTNGAIIKARSILDGAIQPVTTIFVGTSPELEMALYTICFYTRPNYPCPIKLGGAEFMIIVTAITYDNKNILVSAYPEI